ARPRPAVTSPPSNELAPSNPAAIPCNPRRDPTPRCHQITKADEMSKTPTIRPAVSIARNAPDVFIQFGGAYSGKQKIRKQETIATKIDWLIQIRKSALQRTRKRRPAFQICGVTRKTGTRDKNFVSFLFSWIPDLLLSLGRNAFAHSNSNRSP